MTVQGAGTGGADDAPAPAAMDTAARSPWAAVMAVVAIVAIVVVAGAWVIHLKELRPQVPVTFMGPQQAAPGAVPAASDIPAGGSAPAASAVAGSAGNAQVDRIDQGWAASAATATGIGERAFLGYASASLTMQQQQPSCGLGWNTLAAIGTVESSNGTFGGATVLPDGYTSKPIIGVPLDGGKLGSGSIAAIPDTDHGKLDGDPKWDHAVGPMQFLPSTWATWGSDGNGDGVASPDQIDDAALAAARYLCASGTMTTPSGWQAAVFSYNQSDSYVDEVANLANQYAAEVAPLG